MNQDELEKKWREEFARYEIELMNGGYVNEEMIYIAACKARQKEINDLKDYLSIKENCHQEKLKEMDEDFNKYRTITKKEIEKRDELLEFCLPFMEYIHARLPEGSEALKKYNDWLKEYGELKNGTKRVDIYLYFNNILVGRYVWGIQMNRSELEKIKLKAWKSFLKSQNCPEDDDSPHTDEFTFGFNAGVEALQKELDEAVELLQKYWDDDNVAKQAGHGDFLAKVKRG
jgi:hypothetical protein